MTFPFSLLNLEGGKLCASPLKVKLTRDKAGKASRQSLQELLVGFTSAANLEKLKLTRGDRGLFALRLEGGGRQG